MSKAIITIEDIDNDGSVNINLDFDPPLEEGKPGNATAQYLASKALAYLQMVCNGEDSMKFCELLECKCDRADEQVGDFLCKECPHDIGG